MGFEEMREGGVGKSVRRRGDEFEMLSEVKERVCKILQLLVKEEMLNAAVSRANSLEEQLSATKKALDEALSRQEELLAYIDKKKNNKKKFFGM